MLSIKANFMSALLIFCFNSFKTSCLKRYLQFDGTYWKTKVHLTLECVQLSSRGNVKSFSCWVRDQGIFDLHSISKNRFLFLIVFAEMAFSQFQNFDFDCFNQKFWMGLPKIQLFESHYLFFNVNQLTIEALSSWDLWIAFLASWLLD